jgi:uncharacterized protein (TIGR02266 family)
MGNEIDEPGRARRALRRIDTTHLDADVDIGVATEHNFFTGFSDDLTESGIFVATYVARSPGEVLVVQFRLPGIDRPLRAVVEVRWTRAYDPASDTEPGFGAHFLEISAEDRSLVRRFVGHRAPLFHDG